MQSVEELIDQRIRALLPSVMRSRLRKGFVQRQDGFADIATSKLGSLFVNQSNELNLNLAPGSALENVAGSPYGLSVARDNLSLTLDRQGRLESRPPSNYVRNTSVVNGDSVEEALDQLDEDIRNALAAVSGGSTQFTVDFGGTYKHYQEVIVSGQSWVTAGSDIVVTPFASTAAIAMEMAVLQFHTIVHTLVPGDGFTVTIFTPVRARGPYTFSCVG